MNGTRWAQLVKAFNSLVQALQSDPATSTSAIVSVSLFNTQSTLVTQHATVAEVPDIAHYKCGGGTSFDSAFAKCCDLINKSPPCDQHILFMTDGEASFPKQSLSDLLANHASRLKRVNCIAFGKGADTKCLGKISEAFMGKGVQSSVRNPGDEASLITVFREAVQSIAVHGA